MPGQRRKGIRESETVGQHNVITAAYAQLTLVELIGIEHAVQDTLCRRHHNIRRIQRHAAHMPLPTGNILLHLLKFRGVILLHPHVFDGPLIVQHKVGVLVHQRHVLRKGILNVLIDCCLDIPVPLGIKVCI